MLRFLVVSSILVFFLSAVVAQGQPRGGSDDVQGLKSQFKKLSQLRKELGKLEGAQHKLSEKYRKIPRSDPKRQELRQKMHNLSFQGMHLRGDIRGVESGLINIIRRIADSGNRKALSELLAAVFGSRKRPELDIEEATLNTLAETKNESTTRYLIEALAGNKSRKIACVLCEVMRRSKEKKAVDVLLKLLGKGSEEVKISAAQALSDIRAKKVVGPMIDALASAEKVGRKESVARALSVALQNMTGQYELVTSGEFRYWWEKKGKDSYDENTPPPLRSAAKIEKDGELKTILYGIIESKRVIFVCDISGSMAARGRLPGCPGNGETTEEPSPPQLPPVGMPGSPGAPEELPENMGERSVEPGYKGMRVTMLKIELAYVVHRVLGEDAKFNIITFAQEVQKWKKSLTWATDKNRGAATEFVKKMQAIGGTNTYAALEEAFKDREVDTIYFLSDGNPSVGEKTGHGDILAAVRRWNRGRSVIVHTIGLLVGRMLLEDKDRLVEFLTKLADENGGTVKILSDN